MRTTNSLLIAALASLLLAGCSQNEITEISPDAAPAVGFKVYTTPQNRGLVTDNSASSSTTTTSIQKTGFGVIAYYTNGDDWNASTTYTPNFMWNQKVEYASSAWGYTPVKYWPNTEGDKISYFAYAPYSKQTDSPKPFGITEPSQTSDAKPTLTFELQTAATDMVDLVATKNLNVQKQTGNVEFQFEHLLTRVGFKARHDLAVTSAETAVFVTGVRLLGTSEQTPAAANSSSLFYNKATYDWNAGKWDYTGATKQTAAYDIDGLIDLSAASNFGGYSKQSVKLNYLGAGGTATSLFKANQYLFLIPPTDDATATNGGIKSTDDMRVQIDYDIVTVDANLSAGHSISSTTATVSLPNGTLQRQKAYEFTFTIGLETVKVTATVTDWATPEEVYAPSADAADATATAINAAITILNTAKGANKNCNYFMVNVTGAPSASVALTAITDDKFVAGDKIELKCSTTPDASGTYTLTGWTTTKIGDSITLTKNN